MFKLILTTFMLLISITIELEAITFVVTSPEDDEFAYAYDNPDTEVDESSDGVCGDSLGRCTLRAALQELANIGEGGTVIIQVDKINLESSVYISEGVEIYSNGESVISISMETAFECADNCKIRNLEFEISNYGNGINLGSFCIIENVIIKGNGAATAISMVDENTLTNCLIEGIDTGFFLCIAIGGNKNSLDKMYIDNENNTNMVGIAVDGSDNDLSTVFVYNYSIQGISINGDGNMITNSLIRNNSYIASATGILIIGSNNTFEYSRTYGNGLSGISIGSVDEIGGTNNKIIYSKIGLKSDYSNGANGDGISIMTSNNIIEGNVIGWNKKNGIIISSYDLESTGVVENNVFTRNIIGSDYPNEENGILLIGNVENNIIGSNNDDKSNRISDNKRYGIYNQDFMGAKPKFNSFRKNILFNNLDLGIKNDNQTQEDVKPPKFDSLKNGILYGSNGVVGAKIDIYESDLDESGAGEAKKWIMEFIIPSQNYEINVGGTPENGFTATLTTVNNSTSEFSCNFPSIMKKESELESTFFDKIQDKDDNEFTITFYPNQNITESKYKVNNKEWRDAQIEGNQAKFTVKMGSDFNADAENFIYFKYQSCNGFYDTLVIPINVVSVPSFASPINFRTNRNEPELYYIKSDKVEWPYPNINASISIPSIVPYVGGVWGIKETGLKFELEASSLGSEISKDIKIQGGLGLGDKQFDFDGSGDVRYKLIPGGLQTKGTIDGNVELEVWEREENLLTVIPTTQSICEIPLGSELCAFLNSLVNAGVRASITLDLGGTANFEGGSDLKWTDGELKSSMTLSVVGSANLGGLANLMVEGRGTGTLNIPFPELNPSISGSLEFSAFGQIAGVGSISGEKSWQLGGGIINKNKEELQAKLTKDTSLIILSENFSFDDEAKASTNINKSNAIVWTERISTENNEREIHLGILENNKMSKRVVISKDGNNKNPQIAIDSKNNIIISWEHISTTTESINEINIIEYAKKSKIKYAIYNTELNLISSGEIGNDNLMEFDSKLISNNKQVYLLWKQGSGNTLVGKENDKISIFASELKENTFGNNNELMSESGVLSYNPVVGNFGEIIFSFDKDFDNNLNTSSDREIMLYNQAFSSSQVKQITKNNYPDMKPILFATSSDITMIYHSDGIIKQTKLSDFNNEQLVSNSDEGFMFANPKVINGLVQNTIIWGATRGFYSIDQDEVGKWGNLNKSKEYEYINLNKDIFVSKNGNLSALFNKFDNMNGQFFTEKNQLVVKTLSFDVINSVAKEIEENTEVVYPNPAREYITINLERCATLQKCGTSVVEIYDVMGMKIHSTPVETHTSTTLSNRFVSLKQRIDISNLAPGVYFVKIGDRVEKFVKY